MPAMLLVASTNPNTGQEHDAVTQTQPSSSTPPVPSTSSPLVQYLPPIPASIPTPTPIPETEPAPFEHTFEKPSPVHQHFSPPQEQAQGQMPMDDLLQVVPQLISRIDSLETDLKQTKLTMGNALVKLVKKVKKLEGVASLKPKSIDKGRRYKRRKETKGKKVVSSLDFQEEVDTGAEQVNTAEGVNTGSIKLSTVSEQLSTGSEQVSTVLLQKVLLLLLKRPKQQRHPMIHKEEVAKQVHLDSLLAQRIAEEEELNEQQKKRKAQVQFEAQHYTDEDWDLIRAKIEANAELQKILMMDYRDELEKVFWKYLKNMFEEPLSTDPIWSALDTNEVIKVLPPKTTKEILAKERERKARTTLLMALPEDHLLKFHKMTDAKEMCDAIKSRFCGNDESKKMQKYILKQQFEGFSVSSPKMPIQSSLGLYLLPGPNTSSTNDVSTAYGVSTSSGYNSQRENSSSYTDELMYSFFGNQSSGPQLDHEYLEQLDEFDLEEVDLKWQVAMIFMRLKKFYKNTCRRLQFDAKEPIGFDKTKEEPKALVTLDGKGVDWTGHAEDEQENFALMAYSNLGSDIEEKIRSMKIDLDDKTDVLTYHKKLLVEAVKEKEELKTKLENFQSSSKGLSKLLNSQMSSRDKFGLGYGDQVHEGVLSYENEVFQSVFDIRSSDVEDNPMHDRFANVEGMHAIPPPMTGNYMLPRPDREVDDSMFTYGPKQSKTSESDTQTSNFDSCESNSSVETLESVPEPVVVEPKVVSKPKVWSDAPIIEEYESDSDDEYVIQTSKEQEKPSFAFVNTVKRVKTPRETVKKQNTYSPRPKADKRDWNGLMFKKLGLGYGFTKKACFVCGNFSHLIRDCDFHKKRMAKKVELNKKEGKGTGQGENRPLWNNVQRLNHQNKFVPKAVLTKIGIFSVNTARQNLSSQAATTSTARKVNTTRPIVNEIRPRNKFYKSHSPSIRLFNRTTAPKANFSNKKDSTAEVKAVSAVGGKRETAVKPSAGCN
ncbi:hypothetical protein Tco_1217033 [Tanacetum coccineum]